MPKTLLLKTRDSLNDTINTWKENRLKIGLVPTMGALHAGHLSLVKAVAPHVDRVIVSIFVNPTQFGPGEDFDAYPRTLESDLSALIDAPAHAVYAPRAEDLYPAGFETMIHPGKVAEKFEGRARPGHFSGVATVVSKLILQTHADVAIFGEKDFQQLAVLKQTARDLDLPVQIMGGPIMREDDGLAMSSRNRYLSVEQRKVAGAFNRALSHLIHEVESGKPLRDAEETCGQQLLRAGFDEVDYVKIVDPLTLEDAKDSATSAHVLAVARIGTVRLLDNMKVR